MRVVYINTKIFILITVVSYCIFVRVEHWRNKVIVRSWLNIRIRIKIRRYIVRIIPDLIGKLRVAWHLRIHRNLVAKFPWIFYIWFLHGCLIKIINLLSFILH